MHFDKYSYLRRGFMLSPFAVIYWIHLPEHTDPLTEGYLGVSKNFEIRMRGHLTDIQRSKHKNPHLVHAVQKYGWDNLIKDIIFEGEEAYCYEVEEQMRPKKNTGWNIAPGGHRGPGWTKGKKKSTESIEKRKLALAPQVEASRIERLRKRELRLKKREEVRLEKQRLAEEKRKLRQQRKIEKGIKEEHRAKERERRKLKRISEGTYGIASDFSKRPICKTCNKNHAAVNYIKNGKTHYRSICDECGRKKAKKKPWVPKWQKSGYKKKPTCDVCGFKSQFPSQMTVFHIDGNLENVALSNLRTVCLNCVEVVKRKELNWKRGDLEVDY